jgi:hypothetical protein
MSCCAAACAGRGAQGLDAGASRLRGRRFEHAADQAILDDRLLALEQLEGRLGAFDAKRA